MQQVKIIFLPHLIKLMDELGEGKNCDYSKPDLPQSEALILLSKL